MARPLFDCSKCPAHCCSYDHIAVTDRDLDRLARAKGLSTGARIQDDPGHVPSFTR